MNKYLRLTALVTASIMLLVSCVDKKYTLLDGVDGSIGADMSITGPAVHSRIKLLEPLPESFNSFKFYVDGDEVYLSKQDTQALGNDIKGNLKMYPTGTFTQTLNILPSGIPFTGTIDETLIYKFDGINTNDNERLDSILYRDEQTLVIKLSPNVKITEGHIDLICDDNNISLDPAKYPDNQMGFDLDESTTQIDVDLSLAMIKFVGGKELKMRVTGTVTAVSEITATSKIDFFTTEFKNLQPRVTFGYLGPDRVIYENTKKIPFAYTKDVQGTDFFMPFYNPIIDIDGLNSIGIPAEYELDYVGLLYYNSVGGRDTVFADFNGKRGTKFTIDYPTPSEIESLDRYQLMSFNTPSLTKVTQFSLDRDNGHTDRLFQVKGDSMVYHYRIRPIAVQGNNVSYFFDDSDLNLLLDANMSMRFQGNAVDSLNFFIDRIDTVKIDFKSMKIDESSNVSLSDETMARVKLDFINHLPVDADATYWFVDSSYSKILPDKQGAAYVNAPSLDNNGVVTEQSAETNAYIKLNFTEYKELTNNGIGMLVKYKVANKSHVDIWFKSNDWIDFTVEVWAKGFISYNPEKGGGK